MEEIIINKVSESGLITIDLEAYLPSTDTIVFDLKDFLYMKLILKEKDFRETLKSFDWSAFKNKNVAVSCTADAIIPVWAYMLVVSYLQPVAEEIVYGDTAFLAKILILKNLSTLIVSDFAGKRVIIKGCGNKIIDELAYVEITKLLIPVVKSLMYGEACSTVPIFKAPKERPID